MKSYPEQYQHSPLNHRKGGIVARIRINPKDCLAILDIMEAMELQPYKYSFSGCVSAAISSLIDLARRQGLIPTEETGEQFFNRLGPFLGQSSTRVKRERTNHLYERALNGMKVTPELSGFTKPGDFRPIHKEEFNREAAEKEYQELKKQIDAGDYS